MAKVTVIPATINPLTRSPIAEIKKRRVAAYARVSTDSDEQFTSYEAQKEKYENQIQSNPQYIFVGIYADEGISGTSTKHRKGFNKMIKDCELGKIDLIYTKSVSRFARNVVDSILTIRHLCSIGVEVYFEKENIWTFDPKMEMTLSLMSTLAQEESRSISENVKMGKRWTYQKGKVSLPYGLFLGYRKGEDGLPEIVEEEAKIIRNIYRWFLNGKMTSSGIADKLNSLKITTKTGSKFTKNNIDSILTNEKYKGCALLQKGYVKNYLDHKVVKNNGEIPQYFVNDSHPYIIEPLIWEEVQLEIERRKRVGRSYSSTDIFATKLKCECCGSYYGRKVWHSNSQYKTFIYQCNSKFENKCISPHLKEETVKAMFVRAYNRSLEDKDEAIRIDREALDVIMDGSSLKKRKEEILLEADDINTLINQMVEQNKTTPQDQEEYQARYERLYSKYEKLESELSEVIKAESLLAAKKNRAELLIKQLEDADTNLDEFNDDIFTSFIEEMIVHQDKSITFVFWSGRKVKVSPEEIA